MDVLSQTPRHSPLEVQQCPEHPVLVASLFLVNGLLTVGDHVHGPTEVNDPVFPHVIALGGRFSDAESFLLIAKREAVVAVSAAQKLQNLVVVRICHGRFP